MKGMSLISRLVSGLKGSLPAVVFAAALTLTLTYAPSEAQAQCSTSSGTLSIYNYGCDGNQRVYCTYTWVWNWPFGISFRYVLYRYNTCNYGCRKVGSQAYCNCRDYNGRTRTPGSYFCTSRRSGSSTYYYRSECRNSTSSNGYLYNYRCYYGCTTTNNNVNPGRPYCLCSYRRVVGNDYCTNTNRLSNDYAYIRGCYVSYGSYGSRRNSRCRYGCQYDASSRRYYCECAGNTTVGNYFCSGTSRRYQCLAGTGYSGHYVTRNCPSGMVCRGAGVCTTTSCTHRGVTYRSGQFRCGGTSAGSTATTHRWQCYLGAWRLAYYYSSHSYNLSRSRCTYGCFATGGGAYCKCATNVNPGQYYCYNYNSGSRQRGYSRRCGYYTSYNGSYDRSYYCSYGCYTSGGQSWCRCPNGTTAGQYWCSGTRRYLCSLGRGSSGAYSSRPCPAGYNCQTGSYGTSATCQVQTCSRNSPAPYWSTNARNYARYLGSNYPELRYGQETCGKTAGHQKYRIICTTYGLLTASTYCGSNTCYSQGSGGSERAYCSCSPNKKAGEYYCVGSARYQCQHSSGYQDRSVPSTCPANQFCAGNGTCTACICKNGTNRCNGNQVQVCRNCTTWVTTTTCGTGQFCSGGFCKACVCNRGAFRCNGNELETCRADCSGWQVVQKCAANTEYCDLPSRSCKGCNCTAGSTQCSSNGKSVEKCDTNCLRWYQFKTCDPNTEYCNGGRCQSCACTPNATKCVGNQVQICDASCGSWNNGSTCLASNNQMCQAGKCVRCLCTPGATRCLGGKVQTCNSLCSAWVTTKTCPSNEFCQRNSAGQAVCSSCQCTAGEKRCFGNSIRTCQSDCKTWSGSSPCPSGQKCINYNSQAQCRPTDWCPYTQATKTTICNDKICYQNKCQPWDCTTNSHCPSGQICNASRKCTNTGCYYNNAIGTFSSACAKVDVKKPWCAQRQCRECKYNYTRGVSDASCKTHFGESNLTYCAGYKCRECPHQSWTAHSQCTAINSNLTHCVDYKCAQCRYKRMNSDPACGGKACIDYKCAECNNASKTPQWSSTCATNHPGRPFCVDRRCVECDVANSFSNRCQGKYTNRQFCNANFVCVQCDSTGFSSFCQRTYSKNYCFNGTCQECDSDALSTNHRACNTQKPHCYKYQCVECTNSGSVGSYDRALCENKYRSVNPLIRYCANNTCVECPLKAKGKSSACPPSKSVCSNYKCYQCVTNSDCPIGENCKANKCVKPTQQCGACTSDAFCAQNQTSGASCGAGKTRCDPKSNSCVECLVDTDCGNGKRCRPSDNTCQTSNCPSSCQRDSDCSQTDCGSRNLCVNGACTDAGGGSTCAQPNIIVVTDDSCSMTWTSGYWADTRQPCASNAACTAYFAGLTPPYVPHYSVRCLYSNNAGQNTCHASRWDAAMAALRKVVHDFGGTAASLWRDRKVRWGKIFFHGSPIMYGNQATPALWCGISDTPNTTYILGRMQARPRAGGTNYENAFRAAEQHFQQILPTDPQPGRVSAIIFTTDGAPGEGCGPTRSPAIVDRIYNMPDAQGQPRKIKSYIVGFGSGLGTRGEDCLKELARKGRTNALKCGSGRCLEFYAADSAAELANALQDIVNQATQEVCDGLDNDCDGIIDNNTIDACNCTMSYSRPTPTTAVNPQTVEYRAGIRLYTFIAAFDVQGKCPAPNSADHTKLKQYRESCRNDAQDATTCTPNKSAQLNPAGDAYGYYCKRCCGNGLSSGTCSWPTTHSCNTKPWTGTCEPSCGSFCKQNKQIAVDCDMPVGFLTRSGTGYDRTGNLTVLSVKEFSAEALNKQPRRWIFVNLPGTDHRTRTPDNRPLIAQVAPDDYYAPTGSGVRWTRPAGWGLDYRLSSNNAQLTPARMGIDSRYCVNAADCALDKNETIWYILGYDDTSGNPKRANRMGAIYHSNPTIASPVNATIPDPGHEAWVQVKQLAGSFSDKTVRDRPSVVYVGTAAGLLSAFNVNTGTEIWGFIPRAFLEAKTSTVRAHDTLREAVAGRRTDGTRPHLLDGSPLVQDVQTYRYVDGAGNIQAQWRTVLLSGLRSGGRGFFALDITNPYRPRMLWEITKSSRKDPNNAAQGTFDKMAFTYGQAYVANVLINFQGRRQERAVAFLPAGIELKKPQSKWVLDQATTQGSVMYAVDLETGVYLTELSTRHSTTDCRGNSVNQEKSVAAAAVGYNVPPSLTTRIFFGDVLGNIFRADIDSLDPSNWQAKLFYKLFTACERSEPIMTAPAIALNNAGEVVIFGGTGDLQDLDSKLTHNKIYSLREKITTATNGNVVVEAIPNFLFNLNKVLTGEHTQAPSNTGPQSASGSYTGEKITGPPVIFSGGAYFTTYTPAANPPVCGISGHSRVYGIHFNDGCRTENCYPLASGKSGSVSHFYQRLLAYVEHGGKRRTPLQACEGDNTFNSGSSDPPSDSQYKASRATCGDLNFTVPMLVDQSTSAPYEYFRYLGMGANTLAMGVTFSYQPGDTTVDRITNPNGGHGGHKFNTSKGGRQYLSFQVAGKTPASDANWRLKNMRAVKIPPQSLQKGAFSTIGLSNTFAPVRLFSWGLVLD